MVEARFREVAVEHLQMVTERSHFQPEFMAVEEVVVEEQVLP